MIWNLNQAVCCVVTNNDGIKVFTINERLRYQKRDTQRLKKSHSSLKTNRYTYNTPFLLSWFRIAPGVGLESTTTNDYMKRN